MADLIARLKQRKLVQWALAYLAGAWVTVEVLDVIGGQFGWPNGLLRGITLALGVGFFVALVLAWYHGEKGAQRVSGTELLILALLLAIGGGLLWGLAHAPETAATDRAQTSQAAPVAQRSVAVLPFLALSHGEDDEHFADGLTEELLNALAALRDLRVTARTSSFHFKGKDVPVPEIAHALGVAHVVEGSVRRAGERLRITAQLIRAEDGFHLWSQSYDRELADVFAVQLDIATNIAEALEVVLDETKLQRMRDAGVQDVDAFVAYQKGYAGYTDAHAERLAERNAVLAESNRHFDLAIARVPRFPMAHFFRADLPGHQLLDAAAGEGEAGVDLATAQVQLSRDMAAASAQTRDPLLRAKVEYARIFLSDDWHGLAAAADRMLSDGHCDPMLYAYVAAIYGRAAAANELMRQRIVECDRLDAQLWTSLLSVLAWGGDPRGMLETADRGEARVGALPRLDRERLFAYLALRKFDAAERLLGAPTLTAEGREELRIAVLAMRGRGEEARVAAARLQERVGSDRRRLLWAAWTGDRNAANAAAARIDARPLGAAALSLATEQCRCGAPFDLSATPNFAARLAESGFPWPPPIPTRFPDKDWP